MAAGFYEKQLLISTALRRRQAAKPHLRSDSMADGLANSFLPYIGEKNFHDKRTEMEG